MDIKIQANTQANEFVTAAQEACTRQQAISMNKTSCDPTSPSSAIFFPAYTVQPDLSWFDPFSGLCVVNAPPICGQMFTVINSAETVSQGVFSGSPRSCPGGGTACISKVEITTTPLGTKYTFKSKTGKSFSYYTTDFKDEKSLVKAGLTPAQAKNLLKEIEATKKSVDKTATATSSQLNKLAQTAKFSVLEQNAEASKKAGAKAKPVVANFPTQTAAAAVVIDRRPSLEGLSKSVNGDLIGVKGDNIFKMINRRYQDKEQQIWFFGQYQ